MDTFLRSLDEQAPTKPATVPLVRSCPFPSAAHVYMTRLSIYGRPPNIKHATVSMKHLLGVFAETDLADLQPSAIDRYALYRRNKGVVDRTINGELIASNLRCARTHYLDPGNSLAHRQEGLLQSEHYQRVRQALHSLLGDWLPDKLPLQLTRPSVARPWRSDFWRRRVCGPRWEAVGPRR